MVYLQDPFPLPYNQTLKLRMGRTTLALQVILGYFLIFAVPRVFLLDNLTSGHHLNWINLDELYL